jgi:hypothetical protein
MRPFARPVALLLVGLAALHVSGCEAGPGGPDPSHPRDAWPANAPPAGAARVDRPFVVFNRHSLAITRLGVPVAAPVSVGSSPSPATIRSDDPSIVRVEASGALVGVASGVTRVRSSDAQGQSLEVAVRAAPAVAIWPDHLELEAGRSGRLRLVDAATGEELPPSGGEWSSSSPGVASVREGFVQASQEPGRAFVQVHYGDAVAHAMVTVSREGSNGLAVYPPGGRLRAGELRYFQASSRDGPVAARWQSGNAAVLAVVGEGLFQALRPGRATACAVAQGTKACTTVEVAP